MGQTLVVAEKPSVGRDIAAALPGTFKSSQDKTHLVGDAYVITWTVGHRVGLADLEAAARARSEADWIVGMNATRAATIRLRSAFDGAVSLGRVQTPTLALVVRRELEIRAFVPEPYWLVEARFGAEKGDYSGRYMGGKRLKAEDDATTIVDACRDRPGTITKLEKKEEREQPFLLYDLTTL